jgi:hypothetical protein
MHEHPSSQRPQKSILKIVDTLAKPQWSYEPGEHPALDEAIANNAAAFGTVWSPHLLGPDQLSFKQFLCLPEVVNLCPIGSDARFALEDLQQRDGFDGDRNTSKRALTAYIKQSALFQHRHSYRWVQRIFNSIWRNYDGLVAAKKANVDAVVGAVNSVMRADERKLKDAARKAASRSADPAVKTKIVEDKVTSLREQAAKLRVDAEKKETQARAMLAASEQLSATATRKEQEAARLECGAHA